ncbi:MAG: hypothetical protein HYY40_12545 [Bacteroidetes bacterium]|nr:hypothetical protein [Bacteroidota bacterium]
MKTLKLLTAGFIVASTFGMSDASAQKLAAENTVEISGKSKRGYLGNVVVDDTKQQLDLVFVTKSTNRKVKFQVYQFDYDLKLINQFADEQEVERAREKYKWIKAPKEDVQVFNGVTAEGDMMGNLVFKKKEITLKYNWWTGKYQKEQKILDKLKPKSEDGKSYLLSVIGMDEDGKQQYSAFDIDETGEVIAIVGEKGKIKDDPYKHQKEFKIMKANGNLDMTVPGEVTFANPHTVIYCGLIKEGSIDVDEVGLGDIAIVYAPIAGQGYGKIKDPNPTTFTYVRIGRDGIVKEKIDFTTKAAKWTIDAVYETEGQVIIYGPGKILKTPEDAYRGAYDFMQKEKGFENFQIVGIKDGKAAFVTAPNLDEFEAKNSKPDNQKKPVLYKGGRIEIGGLDITSSGDLFINAQEWSYDAMGSYRGKKYHDFLMFHFDKAGNLVKCYGIDNPQKAGLKGTADPRQDPKYYQTSSKIFEGSDKNSVFWMQFFIGNVERRSISEDVLGMKYTYTWWTPRKQVRIGKIDISGATVGNFTAFGEGSGTGKKFYLMNEFPVIEINGGKQAVFIGEDTNIWGSDSSGDYLWLGKFDPSKM